MTTSSDEEKESEANHDNLNINSMPSDVGNAIFFQIAWFICVASPEIIAIIAVSMLLIIHSRFMIRDNREWLLIMGFTTSGMMIDSVLQTLGVIQFSGAIAITENVSILPIWMMCLWLAFSTTLIHGLFWLHGRFKFAMLIGGFAVPVSYYGGLIMSRSSSIEPVWIMLITVGAIWALLLPSVLFIAQKYGLTRLRQIPS
ncbi:DUF2878 domain-containing protein [Marinomonas sp. 15G1-11]|uniref:DUF2878 domain-containing protein n=1 Tax=Marinomonas phaeophyticola TaxID=3004091 RepID=A0ABT4JSJ6_9GAMM|nr:DUF2878 domain-containing protein [Marinomonas sp. 15G1-11]MCZ2721309.1 DUF2878 domain-containing protein [Marinomonas sp. 15G1-11]